jgi:hypothetical protein
MAGVEAGFEPAVRWESNSKSLQPTNVLNKGSQLLPPWQGKQICGTLS